MFWRLVVWIGLITRLLGAMASPNNPNFCPDFTTPWVEDPEGVCAGRDAQHSITHDSTFDHDTNVDANSPPLHLQDNLSEGDKSGDQSDGHHSTHESEKK